MPDHPEMQTTEINGREYQTIPLNFDAAIRLKLELAGIVSTSAGGAIEALFSGSDGLDMRAIGQAIQALPEGIASRGGPELIKRILATTSATIETDGKRRQVSLSNSQVLTQLFSGGRWGDLYHVLGWVLMANYAPFGTNLSDLINGFLMKLQSYLDLEIPETTNASELSNESNAS